MIALELARRQAAAERAISTCRTHAGITGTDHPGCVWKRIYAALEEADAEMGTRHSEYREDPLGWYVEHPDVSIALFDKLDELGLGLEALHDPSCGQGNIVDVALARGIRATGADIVDRAAGRFAVRDFLQDTTAYWNIVGNPPYKRAVEFIRYGLAHVLPGGRVIVLAQLSFLSSQNRHSLFDRYCSHVFTFSQRPSIPPGEELLRHGEAIRGSGSRDYAWLGFDPQHAPGSGAVTHWLKPRPRLPARLGKLAYATTAAAIGIRAGADPYGASGQPRARRPGDHPSPSI